MPTTSFTVADDRFHFAQMSDRWWETETCWFSFAVPERKLAGWIYIFARPNIGTVAGGAWIWDDTAHLPWEVLHSANYTAMRLPRDQDLDDITLPTGISIKMLEPLTSYQIGYAHGDEVRLDMRFDAVIAPVPLTNAQTAYVHLSHFDQIGHVTGELMLRGERIAIDCYAMRDRSWGPRPEHRPIPASYVTGMIGARDGFLAITDPRLEGDQVTHGFLLRDGVISPLAEGRRSVERDASDMRVTQVAINARDQLGRSLAAHGTARSRIVINRHTFIDSMSLVQWSIDGVDAWGEDQDLWPVDLWAEHKRRLVSPR